MQSSEKGCVQAYLPQRIFDSWNTPSHSMSAAPTLPSTAMGTYCRTPRLQFVKKGEDWPSADCIAHGRISPARSSSDTGNMCAASACPDPFGPLSREVTVCRVPVRVVSTFASSSMKSVIRCMKE